MSIEGLRIFKSRHDPVTTLDRAVAAVARNGMKVIARIDHGALAEAAGAALRPTVVLMFGNAKAGAPTVQTAQTLAIDLPLKLLVWQDAKGETWAAYNDPIWLLRRHAVDDEASAEVMNDVLANVAGEATG
ncbi:MAG: DUF302 domain-containing protein [Reyranella sp.]|nr:DUF302 domain-containing protein [Reyranella sp.]